MSLPLQYTRRNAAPLVALAGLGLVLATGSVEAQNGQSKDVTTVQDERQDTVAYRLDAITVTATRSPREVFATPAPVDVVGRTRILDRSANSLSSLFKDLPGLDVTGVGVTQVRPVIRGQRGQRLLLLADGLRLNNSRRQQDFGELPSLVDLSAVERVEIVRGPGSVLYGTDAIGGVINIITRPPAQEGYHGSASHRFGAEEGQHRSSVRVFGRTGRLDFQAGGSRRTAGSYKAPSGSFGDITLAADTRVHDTGADDWSFDFRSGFELTPNHRVFGKVELYDSENAGFGYVDPAAYAPGQPSIIIRYPSQRFQKLTFGYGATELSSPIADRVDFMAYRQTNERDLSLSLNQSFGPTAPPGAGMTILNDNYTDMRTVGFRLETKKLVGGNGLLTYGLDLFRDRSENTDRQTVTIEGFGPPQVDESAVPQIPNAGYRSFGGFLQAEWDATDDLSFIVGGRAQEVVAETRVTAGLDNPPDKKVDRTVVGSANAIYGLTGNLSLVATVGRAFRVPNLIEWFFDGPTPEGSGYQVANSDLKAEKSLNKDLGLRYRAERFSAEAFVFRNDITDGVRIAPLGTDVQGLPAFTNVNIAELRYQGVELSAEFRPATGLDLSAGFSHVDSKDELNPNNPIGETFTNKVTGQVRWTPMADRLWLEYGVRHNGRRKDVELGENPIGPVLPAFTVHDARAGLTMGRTSDLMTHRLILSLNNLTDELYAEFSNASFFRPEPRRNLTLTWAVAF